MIEIIREETLQEREERRKAERKEGGKRKKTGTGDESLKENGSEELTEEKKDSGIPKNIRQIGESSGLEKIYIEDYVMTYMKQLAAYGDEKPKVLVLYGKKHIMEGQPYWFISGAVQAEAIDSFMDQIVFDESLWENIDETANVFFKDLSIVGWALLKQNGDDDWDEKIVKTHREVFRFSQKIFFEYIVNQKMENMYLFENGRMDRQPGFYIYYERNEPMQNYMIAYKERETGQEEEFTGDKATRQFRTIVQERKERLHRRHTMGLLYGTSAVLVMVIMIIGITMLNNYEKMQSMEKVLYEISGQMDEVQSNEPKTEEDTQDLAMTLDSKANQNLDKEVIETSAQVADADTSEMNKENGMEADQGKNEDNAKLNPETNTDGVNQENPQDNAWSEGNGEESDTDSDAMANPAAGNQTDVNTADADSAISQETNTSVDNASNTQAADAENVTDTPQNNNSATSENISQDNQADGQAAKATSTPTPKEYIIQKGDTLAKISRKFYGNESMIQKICELNNIQNMDNILYGEKILLP